MAVFYVLPPRASLGEALARFLRPYLPGLALTSDAGAALLDALAESQPAYFVHREDLPGEDLAAALRDGYGAEPGDQVVHVAMGPRPDEPRVRVERLPAESPAPPVGRLL